MWITGYTSSRLEKVKTLDKNEPYKIGVNGVFNIQPEFIEYELDGIFYKTFLSGQSFGSNKIKYGNVGSTQISKSKSYITTIKSTPQTTIFRVEKTGDDFEYKPLIKEEEKLEQVFLPEIDAEIFIERAFSNIFERQMRFMDINNIGQLETYKNGFYKIKKQ
jgi:hypothetical protein